MTFEEARAVFDEQAEVRYDGMIFDRIKAMRVEKIDGKNYNSLELSVVRDDGRGRGECMVRAKCEDVERFRK